MLEELHVTADAHMMACLVEDASEACVNATVETGGRRIKHRYKARHIFIGNCAVEVSSHQNSN